MVSYDLNICSGSFESNSIDSSICLVTLFRSEHHLGSRFFLLGFTWLKSGASSSASTLGTRHAARLGSCYLNNYIVLVIIAASMPNKLALPLTKNVELTEEHGIANQMLLSLVYSPPATSINWRLRIHIKWRQYLPSFGSHGRRTAMSFSPCDSLCPLPWHC